MPTDPELAPYLAAIPGGAVTITTPADMAALKRHHDQAYTLAAATADGIPFTHEEVTIPTTTGDSTITLSIFWPVNPSSSRLPAIYNIHAGGYITGNRFGFLRTSALSWAAAAGAVCVSVEYRLAPGHPFPAGPDDCWAGLEWVSRHAGDLGIDAGRIMVAGQSAGGNLAAVMALRARDQASSGVRVCAQLIDSGMLDDRMATPSWRQCADGLWPRTSNATAWKAALGGAGGDAQAANIAARAGDLTRLPPALVSVGENDGFRDENVAFAGRLWDAGVPTELHVWPGAFHGFDHLVEDAAVSRRSLRAKTEWVVRMLAKDKAKTKL